jgi:Fe-S-cluster containining protein
MKRSVTNSLPRDPNHQCRQCGTCCVAPDISTLGKPAGTRCRHLAEDLRCSAYAERPAVCRGYRPDEICRQIAAPTLAERVANYCALFNLDQPAKVCSEKTPAANSA